MLRKSYHHLYLLQNWFIFTSFLFGPDINNIHHLKNLNRIETDYAYYSVNILHATLTSILYILTCLFMKNALYFIHISTFQYCCCLCLFIIFIRSRPLHLYHASLHYGHTSMITITSSDKVAWLTVHDRFQYGNL